MGAMPVPVATAMRGRRELAAPNGGGWGFLLSPIIRSVSSLKALMYLEQRPCSENASVWLFLEKEKYEKIVECGT